MNIKAVWVKTKATALWAVVLIVIFLLSYLWRGWFGLALFMLLYSIPLIPLRLLGFYFFLNYVRRKGREGVVSWVLFYVLFWLLLGSFIYLQQDFLLSWAIEIPTPIRILGLGLFVGGFILAMWAVAEFDMKSRVIGIPLHVKGHDKSGSRLVVAGPYRIVRHPEYVSEALAILGLLLVTGVLSLLLPMLLWAIFVYPVTTLEEKELEQRFGDDYRRYARKVGRLLPLIGKHPPEEK